MHKYSIAGVPSHVATCETSIDWSNRYKKIVTFENKIGYGIEVASSCNARSEMVRIFTKSMLMSIPQCIILEIPNTLSQ